MNLTVNGIKEPTTLLLDECKSWCIEQHINHAYEGVWFIAVAFTVMTLLVLYPIWSGIFNIREESMPNIMGSGILLVYLLQIGFFIWFFWIR